MAVQFVIVKGIQNKNDIIPIWDENIVFNQDENMGDSYTLKNDHFFKTYNLVDCVFDVVTKQISLGTTIDIYPEQDKLEYVKGEILLYEKSHRKLKESKLVDIIYEEYETKILRTKDLVDYPYYTKYLSKEFTLDAIFCFRIWKPTYVTEDGFKTIWSHQLYKVC